MPDDLPHPSAADHALALLNDAWAYFTADHAGTTDRREPDLFDYADAA